MKRIKAAWRLRTIEDDHLASIFTVVILIAATLVAGAFAGARTPALVGVGGWIALYVWGLWDEGGRILRDEVWRQDLRRR